MSDPKRAYYVWRARHPQGPDITLDEFVEIYRLGGGDNLRASARVAGLTNELRELIWWLEAGDDEVEALAEADGGSAYWKSS